MTLEEQAQKGTTPAPKRKRGYVNRREFTTGDGTNGTVDISNFIRAVNKGVREDLERYRAEQDAARYKLDGTRVIR